jgi:uncharacterized 2Fe-2S/4Fe-4S cluster protein (DUF4445 family)
MSKGKKTYKVIFQPSGSRGAIKEGTTILEAARDLGVGVESICGGKQTCGKCKIIVQEGFFEKFGINSKIENLSPVTTEEKRKLKSKELSGNYRLACSSKVKGDVLVFVPEESRSGGQIVRKAAGEVKVDIDPPIAKYYVEIVKPTLEDSTPDLERLQEGLKKDHGLKKLEIDFMTLRELPDVLRKAEWKVTVSLWKGKEIIKVEPGVNDIMIGLAIDIGTTTVVGYLTDLRTGEVLSVDSMMNPQVMFGEDVMARITYAMSHKEGLRKMNESIINGLNKIIKNATKKVGLKPDDVLELVLVGNTAMHHIFLGINPEPVGLSPFPPTAQRSIDVKARDMGLIAAKGANVHTLPIEAGFVGADNMGVVLAVEPHKSKEILLIIDIGTNGEIVLGNRDRLLSTSCATGPAFEGAQIKFGMRAAPGAIERIKIDPKTLEVRFKVIGNDSWHTESEGMAEAKGICGSGIIEAISEMFRAGITKKNGTFNSESKTPRLRKNEKGQFEFVIAWKHETSIGKDISVTLSDVRAMQLAKGALYTGCKTLMKRMGIDEVDKVILAGAFGSYIDREAAMVIGMFPDCDLKKVVAVGNAAGDGARIALLNQGIRKEANKVAKKITYIELTVDPDFQKEFMQAMYFPHMKDTFKNVNHILEKIPR